MSASKNLLALLALALVTTAAGCAVDPDDRVILEGTSADGKADSISGRGLRLQISGEERIRNTSVVDVATVVEATSDELTVEGKRYVVSTDSLAVDIRVDNAHFLSAQRLVFLLGVRSPDEVDFKYLQFTGTNTDTYSSPQQSGNSFSAIKINPVLEQVTFELYGVSDEIVGPLGDLAPLLSKNETVEFGVFVFPIWGLGSLEGSYDYELTARADFAL